MPITTTTVIDFLNFSKFIVHHYTEYFRFMGGKKKTMRIGSVKLRTEVFVQIAPRCDIIMLYR